jgi:mRNA interferase MazF
VNVQRGDVVLAWFPNATGVGGKKRPCVVIQNDEDNRKIANTVIAFITSTLSRRGDKSHVYIDVGTPEGKQAGLLHDSIISCNNLATIEQNDVHKIVGSLAPATVQELNECLRAALEIT